MKSKSTNFSEMAKVTFKTKDDVLIMDRESDLEISAWDKDTQTYILNCDARQRGVKILSIQRDGKNIDCIVEWLFQP